MQGTFVYNPAQGTILPAGTHALSVTFTPADTSLQPVVASVSLTVNQKALTITARSASRRYGQPNPTFSASYSGFIKGDTSAILSGSPTFTTTATVDSDVGSYPITPSGLAPTPNYTYVYRNGTLKVTSATLTITAKSVTRKYGAENPEFTATYSGFVLDHDASILPGPVVFTTAATAESNVGKYPIVPSGLAPIANYTYRYRNGTLNVTKAVLTITADSATREYGLANPDFTATYSGFVLGQDASVLPGSPTFATTATVTSRPGSYRITPSGIPALPNYTYSYRRGALVITKAPLIISGDNISMMPGDAVPPLSASYSGFRNGETVSVLSGVPKLVTAVTSASPVGDYPITTTQGTLRTSANYSFQFVDGVAKVLGTQHGTEYLVTNLYRHALDRMPTASELSDGVATAQVSASDIFTSVLLSDAYSALNTSDHDFLVDMYGSMLNRAPDGDGYRFWSSALGAGMDRETILRWTTFYSGGDEYGAYCVSVGAAATTSENRRWFDIRELARRPQLLGVLSGQGAHPSAAYVNEHATAFADGALTGRDHALVNLVDRSAADALTNRLFVQAFYECIMGRYPDAGGHNYWAGRLDTGLSRSDLIITITGGVEFPQRCARLGIIPYTVGN